MELLDLPQELFILIAQSLAKTKNRRARFQAIDSLSRSHSRFKEICQHQLNTDVQFENTDDVERYLANQASAFPYKMSDLRALALDLRSPGPVLCLMPTVENCWATHTSLSKLTEQLKAAKPDLIRFSLSPFDWLVHSDTDQTTALVQTAHECRIRQAELELMGSRAEDGSICLSSHSVAPLALVLQLWSSHIESLHLDLKHIGSVQDTEIPMSSQNWSLKHLQLDLLSLSIADGTLIPWLFKSSADTLESLSISVLAGIREGDWPIIAALPRNLKVLYVRGSSMTVGGLCQLRTMIAARKHIRLELLM